MEFSRNSRGRKLHRRTCSPSECPPSPFYVAPWAASGRRWTELTSPPSFHVKLRFWATERNNWTTSSSPCFLLTDLCCPSFELLSQSGTFSPGLCWGTRNHREWRRMATLCWGDKKYGPHRGAWESDAWTQVTACFLVHVLSFHSEPREFFLSSCWSKLEKSHCQTRFHERRANGKGHSYCFS